MRPGTYPSEYPGTRIGYGYLSGLHKEQFVAAALQAQDEGYDAYLIATIPDTGYEEIRSLVDILGIVFLADQGISRVDDVPVIDWLGICCLGAAETG
ncbi:hypothetical protein [Arthrobacter methylotrophus]|uniref:Uncharacterized protein n=2 Tax=Arthrobacter methylotrophus TaxID=121291 RepID=A0ABV5UJK7_9MICC